MKYIDTAHFNGTSCILSHKGDHEVDVLASDDLNSSNGKKLKCSDNIKLWFPVRKRVLSMLFNTCEIALCDSKSPIHLYFLVKGTMCPLAEVWPLLGDNIAAQHQKKV